MNILSNTKTFSNALLLFFAFGFIFPTIRVLIIGHDTSQSSFEYLIASLPELMILCIAAYSVQQLLRTDQKINFKFLDWMMLAFIASNVLLGFILAKNLKLSFYGFRMTYFPMIFYFLARLYNFSNTDLKKMLRFFFLSIVVLVLIGHVLYFWMPQSMIDMILKSGGKVNSYFIIRMTSLFWTPVVFGAFAAAGFLYFYYDAIENDHWSSYACMALLWSGAVLSVSRGAIIPLIFGFIIFSCVRFRWKVLLKTFLVMAGVVVLLAFYINSPAEFFQWFWGSSLETVTLKKGVTRVDLWIKAFQNFQDRPFGYGLGMAGHTGARFLASESKDSAVFSTDGWFLKLANETGIWGVASYLVLAIAFLVCFVKKIRENKSLLLLFLLIVFIVFNIQNLVSNTFDFYLFSYVIWLLMGIAVNQYYKTGHE